MKTILVCNAGSTSLKFKLFRFPQKEAVYESKIERIGDGESIFYRKNNLTGAKKTERFPIPGYREGIGLFLAALTGEDGALPSVSRIDAVGFKTVIAKGYGGVHLLNDDVLDGMREFLDIAPSHNGPYLDAIGLFREALPGVPLVGVFETAFHRTVTEEKTTYPLPLEWREKYGLRRYGYHGASHGYIAGRIAELYGEKQKLISLHLGGSSSVCAIYDGKSVDTSFGFSLQTGLPHASRSGDADVFTVPFLMRRGLKEEEIAAQIARNSGLKGLSGVSGDLRDVEAEIERGNGRAALALDVFVCSAVKYVGAFYTELQGLDLLVFTGGIGENSALVREKICEKLGVLGVKLSTEKNRAPAEGERVVSEDGSAVSVLILPTNEEVVVAEKTYGLLYGD